MENNQKWIHLCYVAAAALLAFVVFLLVGKFASALELDGRIHNLETLLRIGSMGIGVITFVILYRSGSVGTFMNEVVTELSKVTWPTQDETVKATIAVMIAVTIAGFILWVADTLWVQVLRLVL